MEEKVEGKSGLHHGWKEMEKPLGETTDIRNG